MPFNVLRQEPLQIALSVDPGRQELINAFASWMDGLIPDVEIDRFINNENDSSVRLALVALKNWYITEVQTPDQHINRVSDGRLAQAIRSLYTVGLGDVKDLEYLTQRAINILKSAGPGAWYDPSDLTTLFQDSAGTTPVTAVEQPVGLMLDKSQGLVLGSELVPSLDFATWGSGGGVSARTTNSFTTTTAGGLYLTPTGWSTAKAYRVRLVGTSSVAWNFRNTENGNGLVSVASGAFDLTIQAVHASQASTLGQLYIQPTGAGTISFTTLSIKELPGNHLIQPTATSRPTLSSRYNLLTKTEQFDDAVWAKSATIVTANATTAPDGTTTADKLISTAVSGFHNTGQVIASKTASAIYMFSFYAKAAEIGFCLPNFSSGLTGAGIQCLVNLSTGVVTGVSAGLTASATAVDNGWFYITLTATGAANTTGFNATINTCDASGNGSHTGDGTSGIYVWGASLVPASDASLPYQRINTATDYDFDFSKFPPFLRFDGVDDSMYSAASVDFNGLPADGQVKRNLLSASGAFDDGAWIKSATTVTVNAAVAPDGTTTADKLISTAVSGFHNTNQILAAKAASTPYTFSFYAKAAEIGFCIPNFSSGLTGAGIQCLVNLSTGVVTGVSAGLTASATAVDNGWFYITLTATGAANTTGFNATINTCDASGNGSHTGDGTSGVHIWGAQLEAGSTATAYQKTGTDKMTVFAGVHKASDAAMGVLVENSASSVTTNGSFGMTTATDTSGADYWSTRGTVRVPIFHTRASPVTRVFTAVADIAGDIAVIRSNGTQVESSSADQGTGNYGNYPLYIGRRNNASLPFNGRIYQLALKGKALSAAEISTVEAFVNSKTKAF